jgi:flagellar biosynthesis GTPase FlhF
MSAVLQSEPAQTREFSIALRLDEATRQRLREADGLVAVAEACTVDCHDMAMLAKDNLDSVIAFRKDLEARRKKFVEPAMLIIENAKAEYNPSINAAVEAEAIYRKRLAAWQMAEQARLEDLRRQQQEEERKRREQAERDAAAARARAEQAAADARRKAEQEAELQRKAEAEGNARAAREAAARRAKLEEEERQRTAQAAREEERIRMEAAAAQNTTVVPEQQKVAGLTMRDNWVAEIHPDITGDEEERANAAKFSLCQSIAAGRRDLLPLLDINFSTASKLAKAQQKLFSVPGLKAVNRPTTVNRKGG